jgi:hypothetical protein
MKQVTDLFSFPQLNWKWPVGVLHWKYLCLHFPSRSRKNGVVSASCQRWTQNSGVVLDGEGLDLSPIQQAPWHLPQADQCQVLSLLCFLYTAWNNTILCLPGSSLYESLSSFLVRRQNSPGRDTWPRLESHYCFFLA